jgi:hypothetical protein
MSERLSTLATVKLLIAAFLVVFAVIELIAAVHFAKVVFAMLGAFCFLGAILLLPSGLRERPRVVGLTGFVFASAIAAAVPMALVDEKFPKSCSGKSRDLCSLLNHIYGQGGPTAVALTWALLAFLVALASYFVITRKAT